MKRNKSCNNCIHFNICIQLLGIEKWFKKYYDDVENDTTEKHEKILFVIADICRNYKVGISDIEDENFSKRII